MISPHLVTLICCLQVSALQPLETPPVSLPITLRRRILTLHLNTYHGKPLPALDFKLLDLELEERGGPDKMTSRSLSGDPVGLYFELYGFIDGKQVVRAAFILIQGQHALVKHIETELPDDRRKGYATAAIVHLIRETGLSIVPVNERNFGVDFWRALRTMPAIAGMVEEQIDVQTASTRRAIEAVRLNKLQSA